MQSAVPSPVAEIAEFQGLYGSYHVSELLLQKLWLRGDFDDRQATTTDGKALRILHPGTWNRLAGPDFLRAKIALGDRVITGDIEIHFRADAWRQHGHDQDPAYDDVVLHVVLFPPDSNHGSTETSRGRDVPLLVLVDRLWHDMEQYAADDAVTALNHVDPLPLVEELLALDPENRQAEIRAAALRRWREKVYFAGLRIERSGWSEACHQTALEVLGYRFNRPAMLRVAAAFPYERWKETPPSLEVLVGVAGVVWRLRGARPPNHPRRRLDQYRQWMQQNREWPETMKQLSLPRLQGNAATIRAARKSIALARWRETACSQICGGVVDGSRWDTMMCNLVLPFLAAARGAMDRATDAEQLWLAWYPGDVPDRLRRAARHLRNPGRRHPVSNGLFQGLLGLQLARNGPG